MKGFRLPLIVALLAVLPFLGGLGGAFLTEWDDGGFVTQNAGLIPDWEHVKKLATSNLQTVYTPLTSFSLLFDRTVFGLNPAGFHFHNLVLFALVAAALCQIGRELALKPAVAAAITLGWAYNPAKVESVVWISERKTLLAAALLGWSTVWMLRSFRKRRPSFAAPLLLALAPLAKAVALPGAVIAPLYSWNRRPGRLRQNLFFAAPYLVAGAAAGILITSVTFTELTSRQSVSPLSCLTLFLRYLGAAVLPFDLNPIHPAGETPVAAMAAGVITLLLFGLMFNYSGMPRRLLYSFAAIYLAMLAPVLGSGAFTNADYADRYNFIPSAVLWIFGGVLFQRLGGKVPLRLSKVIYLYIGCGALASFCYVPVYCDSAALFSSAAAVDKPNLKAAEGLMLVGFNRENPELLTFAAAAFDRQSGNFTARNMATAARAKAAHLRENFTATLDMLNFLEEEPLPPLYSAEIYYPALFSAAVDAALRTGNVPRAVKLLKKQQQLQLGNRFDLHFNAGLLALLEHDKPRAAAEWQKALELRPDDLKLKTNLDAVSR
ncbi:MAG: hypothetical protein AB7F32_08505 [Victivallaceae bacterium]